MRGFGGKLKVHKLGACSLNPIWGHYFGSGMVAKLTIISLLANHRILQNGQAFAPDLHPNVILIFGHLSVIRCLGASGIFCPQKVYEDVSENEFSSCVLAEFLFPHLPGYFWMLALGFGTS